MKHLKNNRGFTLIELMIAVAIVGILATIAIPAYQDYTRRARVIEGMNLAAGAKLSASEYFASVGSWPDDNVAAGLAATITADAVKSVVVSKANCTADASKSCSFITITYNEKVINDEQLILEGGEQDGAIRWSCDGGSLQANLRPGGCRASGSASN